MTEQWFKDEPAGICARCIVYVDPRNNTSTPTKIALLQKVHTHRNRTQYKGISGLIERGDRLNSAHFPVNCLSCNGTAFQPVARPSIALEINTGARGKIYDNTGDILTGKCICFCWRNPGWPSVRWNWSVHTLQRGGVRRIFFFFFVLSAVTSSRDRQSPPFGFSSTSLIHWSRARVVRPFFYLDDVPVFPPDLCNRNLSGAKAHSVM